MIFFRFGLTPRRRFSFRTVWFLVLRLRSAATTSTTITFSSIYANCFIRSLIMDNIRKLCGLCPTDLLEFGERQEKCDDQLFRKIVNNPHNTLHQLLPPQSTASQQCHLRHRTHDRQLPVYDGHLADRNFIVRFSLYKTHTSKSHNVFLSIILSYCIVHCNFIRVMSDVE